MILAIVGTLDFTTIVGTISTNPPTAKVNTAPIVNTIGVLSIQECTPSPCVRAAVFGANAGASASSFATKCPDFTVFQTLIIIKIAPIKYNVPPNARNGYNHCLRIVTVCKKLPYSNVPSAANCFHIKPCVHPATYIGITQNKIPKVPIQK